MPKEGKIGALLQFFYLHGDRLKEAAARTGLPLGTLHGISAGKRRMTAEIRQKIAEAYCVPIENVPVPEFKPTSDVLMGGRP